MALTLTPLYADDRRDGDITGYNVQCSDPAMRQQEATLLALSLHYMAPYTMETTRQVWERQTMASISLRLAALLEENDIDGDVRAIAHRALRQVHFYLKGLRDKCMRDDVSETEANARIVPGFAYFEYSWSTLPQPITP